jgi:RND family efflux transporter MFP subunit
LAGAGADRTILNASGYVTARREATVSAKVTGKVVEVLIEEGMKVKEGQVLARLDDSNVRTSLDVAEAELQSTRLTLEETRAQLKQADLEFARDTELAKAKFLSPSDLDKAESDAMTLRARVSRQQQDIATAERQVALWKQQIEDMVIRAPFDGVITTKNAQPGEMLSPVSAGGGFTRTGIGTVVDMNSLEIELDVNENYINRVEPAQPAEATLDAYPDWKIPCKVIAIIPTADRQKSTVKVRVGFDKLDPRILPDMSVKVAFRETAAAPVAITRSVLVPKSALLSQDGRDVVFVAREGRAERRAVTVLDTQGDDAVLSAGASAGEMIVVNPPSVLKDGAAIKEKKP